MRNCNVVDGPAGFHWWDPAACDDWFVLASRDDAVAVIIARKGSITVWAARHVVVWEHESVDCAIREYGDIVSVMSKKERDNQ